MIDEYLAPFFWAVLLSIMLQKPKKLLLQWSAPMKNIEGEGLGYIGTIKAKLVHMGTGMVKPLYMLAGAIVIGKVCCIITSWGCWVPYFSLLIGLVIAVGLVVLVVSISKAESLNGFFTTVLVFGFLIMLILFVLTFGFKAVTETGDFAFKIQDLVEEKIHDPKWGDMMIEYGITEEAINEGIETGRVALSDWAQEQGYNITEIEETIVSYGAMLSSGDEIDVVEEVAETIATEAEEIEGGWMDMVPNISLEEVQGYYESVMEIVDMEAISSVASSVGDVLFSSTSGILGVFSSIIASLLGAVDALLQFIVFIGALFYFMEADESFVSTAVRIVPVTRKQQKFLADTIHQNIIQVFVTSFLLSFSHGFATLVYFSIFDLDFAYSSAFIVGAMALFPLTSAWLIYAPSLLIAYLQGSEYVLYIAIGLFLLEQGMGMVDDYIFQMIPGSSPYLTGIGLAVGVSTFGVQGILIGPMLIVTTKTLFDIFCLNVAQPEDAKGINNQ